MWISGLQEFIDTSLLLSLLGSPALVSSSSYPSLIPLHFVIFLLNLCCLISLTIFFFFFNNYEFGRCFLILAHKNYAIPSICVLDLFLTLADLYCVGHDLGVLGFFPHQWTEVLLIRNVCKILINLK